MTNQEILTKAIEQAIARGWSGDWSGSGIVKLPVGGDFMTKALAHYADIIFNHDFAKALWGEACLDAGGVHQGPDCRRAWRFHLQQMVTADDPIKYLGENI